MILGSIAECLHPIFAYPHLTLCQLLSVCQYVLPPQKSPECCDKICRIPNSMVHRATLHIVTQMRLCVLPPLLNHGVEPTTDDVAVNRIEGAMNCGGSSNLGINISCLLLNLPWQSFPSKPIRCPSQFSLPKSNTTGSGYRHGFSATSGP